MLATRDSCLDSWITWIYCHADCCRQITLSAIKFLHEIISMLPLLIHDILSFIVSSQLLCFHYFHTTWTSQWQFKLLGMVFVSKFHRKIYNCGIEFNNAWFSQLYIDHPRIFTLALLTMKTTTIWAVRIYALGMRVWEWRWNCENHAGDMTVERYDILEHKSIYLEF